jgi:hypothetical protein
MAGHCGRAIWDVGFDLLGTEIVGSNPAQGMSFCVVLSCVGTGLATGRPLVQEVLPDV